MSVTSELQVKQSIQNTIKQVMIATKYPDEPISFGQAMVTHHFLQNMPHTQEHQNQQDQYHNQQSSSQTDNNAHSSVIHNISQSITDLPDQHKQTVQWDLLNKQKDVEFNPQFGRKKVMFGNETKDIKDVFNWQGEDGKGYTKRRINEIQSSPNKWSTEQRNNYRVFVQSPSKDNKENLEIKGSIDQIDPQQSKEDTSKNLPLQSQINPQQNRSVRISSNQADSQAMENNQNSQRLPDKKSPRLDGKKPQRKSLKKRALSSKQLKDNNMKKRIDNLNSTTRWLPDSAFTTYFGKPAFHLYGKGNIQPAVGGNIYGQYMLTHNVNPECGEHLPQFQQVYDTALVKGAKINNGVRVPHLPRKVNDEIRLTPGQMDDIKKRNPIMPKERQTIQTQKDGITGKILENSEINIRPNLITIQKPDLTKEKYFNSKHTTPNDSVEINNSQNLSGSKKLKNIKKPKEQEALKDVFSQSKHILDQIDDPLQMKIQQEKQIQYGSNEIQNADLMLQDGQDIGEADRINQQCTCDHHDQNKIQKGTEEQLRQQKMLHTLCQQPTKLNAPVNELNPQNYAFLPQCWVQRIRPAGKTTYKSEQLYNVLVQNPYPEFQDTI